MFVVIVFSSRGNTSGFGNPAIFGFSKELSAYSLEETKIRGFASPALTGFAFVVTESSYSDPASQFWLVPIVVVTFSDRNGRPCPRYVPRSSSSSTRL